MKLTIKSLRSKHMFSSLVINTFYQNCAGVLCDISYRLCGYVHISFIFQYLFSKVKCIIKFRINCSPTHIFPYVVSLFYDVNDLHFIYTVNSD